MAVLNVDIFVNDNGSLAIRKVTEEAKKAESSTQSLKKSTDGLSNSFGSLKSTLAKVGIGALAVEAVKTADSMKLLEARINLTSSSLDSYKSIQQDMTRIANENGIAIQNVGNLYSKLAISLKPLGIQTSSVMTVTDAFSKSLLISGASTEEASSATLQFAQAMASGRLQGDEFRSMAENSPRFMKAMTESLGKTSAEIRQMAEDGKLTTSVVGGALVDSMAKLREEARSMPMTVGKAFNELKNEATLTVEQFDKLTGINDTVAKGFQRITEKVVGLREELPKLSAEMTEWEKKHEKGLYVLNKVGGGLVDGVSFVGGEVVRTWKDFGIIIAETYTEVAGIAGEALGIVNDDVLTYNKNLQQTQSELAKTAKAQKDMARSIEDEVNDYVAKQEFKKIVLPATEVKKQVDKALEEYALFYKAIGDNETYLSIKRYQEAEKYKNLNKEQINSIIQAESDKLSKIDELNKDWGKRKTDLTYSIAEAEQDAFSKPYIELEKKYQEDLEKYGKLQGAKELLTKEYQAKTQALNKEKAEKFNKQEEEKYKKSSEWQVKLFDANEKINDQFITQQEKMYGSTSSAQIESWYQNQLEWLGKLSLEGKATSQELQALLDKINGLKELKLKEQTISFKLEKSFYTSVESGLTNTIEDAFNGDNLNLKSFFSNIKKGLTNTIAGDFSSGIVNTFKSYGGFGGSASLVGTSLSASDVSSIAGLSGSSVSNGMIKTSGGTLIDQASGTITSQGSDAMSILGMASSAKTAYSLITAGISGSIITGFQSASGVLASMGMGGAATGLMSFGAGVANPFAYAGMSGLPTAMTAGSMASAGLIGGVAGYGTGWLGDKIFGADTYASTTGAIGGALGGLGASLGLWGGPIGIIAGSLLGSVLGGLFGKTKVTGQGIDILGNATADDVDGRYYTSYKKKSWFSSKSWENYTGFNAKELEAIKSTIGVYDYLLAQLGEYDDLVVEGGRFANLQEFLDTNVVKAFLVQINPNNLDTIYQSWTDYAAEIDKTITEAIATAVSGYTTYKRGYTEWFLGSGTVEQLAFTSNYLQKDFEALASSLGASSVTVDNFLSMYDAAIKENFTQDTIEAWASLGDTLMKSTDASTKYNDALKSLTTTTATLPADMMLGKVNDQTKLYQDVKNSNSQNEAILLKVLKVLEKTLTYQQLQAQS